MRFLQLMEFHSTADDAVAELLRFKDLMGDQTTVRRAKVEESSGGVTFRNLDVVEVLDS